MKENYKNDQCSIFFVSLQWFNNNDYEEIIFLPRGNDGCADPFGTEYI